MQTTTKEGNVLVETKVMNDDIVRVFIGDETTLDALKAEFEGKNAGHFKYTFRRATPVAVTIKE